MNRFLLFFVIILIVTCQIGLLPGFSPFLPQLLNLPLLLLSFAVFFTKMEDNLIIASLSGFLFDLYSPYFFGFYLIVFVLIIIALKLIIINLLEHKKLLSFLIINLLAIFFWQLSLITIKFITTKFIADSSSLNLPLNFFIYFFSQVIIHSCLILFLYKVSPFFREQLMGDIIN
jgi:hypothetical protein